MIAGKHMQGTDDFAAKKRFGQNFLVDKNVLSCIVERADVGSGTPVLEIGPGQGVLTRALLERGCAVHAVEIDERLRPCLEDLAAEFPNLNLIWGDAMKIPLTDLSPSPSKAVANIPYNITTPLIWRLLELRRSSQQVQTPPSAVSAVPDLRFFLFMVQKEAADRLTAPPDTKERYPLGVTLEVMGETSVVRNVPPECFRPVPRVDSAVIEIKLSRNFELMNDGLWSGMLHRAFAHRRKTLSNNMKGWLELDSCAWGSVFEAADVSGTKRAEDLLGDEWLRVYRAIRERMSF